MKHLFLFSFLFISLLSHSQEISSDSFSLPIVEVSVTKLKSIETPFSVSKKEVAENTFSSNAINEMLNNFAGIYTLSANNFAQDTRLNSRGFGARSAFGIRGIKIITDGLPDSSPDGQGQLDNVDFSNIKNIELLRGPHAGLYGNNSGGVLAINTYNPKDTFKGKFIYQLGSYGASQWRVKGNFNINKLNIQAGYTNNQIDNYRQWSAYKSIIYNINAFYPINDNHHVKFISNFVDNPLAQDPGAVSLVELEKGRQLARDRNLQFQTGENVKQTKVGLIYDYLKNNKSILNFKTYTIKRNFENSLPFEAGGIVTIDRTIFGTSAEYNKSYTTNKIGFSHLLGFDLEMQNDNRKQFANLITKRGEESFNQDEIFINKSAYFLSHISFNKFLSTNINLRYDNVKVEAKDKFLSNGDQSGSNTWNNFNYSFSLNYKFSKNLQASLINSTGFESPTLNELSNTFDKPGGFNLALNPMTSTNYELNVKYRTKKVLTQFSAFNILSKNELIAFEIPNQGGRSYFQNAGKTNRKGIELESSISFTKSFSLSLNYTYSEFKYDSFKNLKGKYMPGNPKNMALAALQWQGKNIFIQLENRFVDELWLNDENIEKTNSYIETNLRIHKSIPIKSFYLTVYGGINNLFDASYYSNVRINAAAKRYYEAAPPRNYYLGMSVAF